MNNGLTVDKYLMIRDIFEGLRVAAGIPDDHEKLFQPEGNKTNESIVERLCSSMQNSGQMRNSIKFNEENRKRIKRAVFDYDVSAFLTEYHSWESLYNALTDNELADNGKKRQVIKDYKNNKKPDTNWEKYAKGLYEGVHFLTDNGNKGFDFVKNLIDMSGKISAVSDNMIDDICYISKQIPGMGIALTCDWLKESGCIWLAKPDTHIVEVYKHLTGSSKRITEKDIIVDMFDYSSMIQKTVDENMTAYKLDKMIWLICTGNFYQYNIQIGRDLIIKRV